MKYAAEYLGFAFSTTSTTAGVKGGGYEDFADTKALGSTKYRGQPAFRIRPIPVMMKNVLGQLIGKGWDFSVPGTLSEAFRQHDMLLLDKKGKLLLKLSLSWQCKIAEEEMKWINEQKWMTDIIGKVEERFIIAKLMWLLKQNPGLKKKIGWVMTTGDYVAYSLTGIKRLSMSDACSNGLVDKSNKTLAVKVLEACGLSSEWFPPLIASGVEIGPVVMPEPGSEWWDVCEMLLGWIVASSLGDNHASAVGCGASDKKTIFNSAGTSGTACRISDRGEKRAGEAVCFEYYDQEFLLLMMERCASLYKDFAKKFCKGLDYRAIDKAIADYAKTGEAFSIIRIRQKKENGKVVEVYPKNWGSLKLAQKAISVQASIALEILLLDKKMLREVTELDNHIERLGLTGGISKSEFFREMFLIGAEILQPGLKLFLSAHKGALAYKSDALGAVINAIYCKKGGNVLDIIKVNCPTVEVTSCGYLHDAITAFLQEHLK